MESYRYLPIMFKLRQMLKGTYFKLWRTGVVYKVLSQRGRCTICVNIETHKVEWIAGSCNGQVVPRPKEKTHD